MKWIPLTVAVVVVVVLIWTIMPRSEPFLAFMDVKPGMRVCPHGTNTDWAPDAKGRCCQGGGCVAPGVYQTTAPRKGDWVCDTGVWGWGTKAGTCCDATGANCTDPRQI